jgi:hypothetical protein
VVELIYLPIDTLGGYLDNHSHKQVEMDPPPPLPPGGVDPMVAAQMRMMQQMADTMANMRTQMQQERQEMHQERERRYAGSCAKNEKRYARREGHNNSNNNKHHCLHHHHQFHLVISTRNL